MIQYQGRGSRRAARVARSQLAVRLGLAAYAVVSVLIGLRCVILAIGFADTVWTVRTMLTLSSPITWPFTFIPAAQQAIVGSVTLADLTAALLILAIPLPFLGRRIRS